MCFELVQWTSQRQNGKNARLIWDLDLPSPQKEVRFFQLNIQRLWSWITIFLQTRFFQRVSFSFHSYLNKNREFFGYAKNGFPLK